MRGGQLDDARTRMRPVEDAGAVRGGRGMTQRADVCVRMCACEGVGWDGGGGWCRVYEELAEDIDSALPALSSCSSNSSSSGGGGPSSISSIISMSSSSS